jgi:hypothetical protein
VSHWDEGSRFADENEARNFLANFTEDKIGSMDDLNYVRECIKAVKSIPRDYPNICKPDDCRNTIEQLESRVIEIEKGGD